MTYRYKRNDNATLYSPNMALNETPPLVSLPLQSYWDRFQSGFVLPVSPVIVCGFSWIAVKQGLDSRL
ncbi:hypothetical protein [Thiomicrorhabdus sp.]|uniref:hypothetical protein n=1 Tax=Thiomicrorhabdus sp. TaxID=2039724 RepID=UPI0029C8B12F|nr:hypothetical protein [Thiomicrorhabdus sp.]